MKLKLILTLVAGTLLFGACKKNEHRINGTWLLTKVTQAGNDVTSTYTNGSYRETFNNEAMAYSFSGKAGKISTGSGNYEWNSKEEFTRYAVFNYPYEAQPTVKCKVKELKRKSFKYSYTYNGEEWAFEFKR
ncbi:MAG: hypothetical protein JNL57_02515 [Bacteroidetes bacterium]|nr:hypothetical protein [Bacteroidota bacterium]